MDGDWSKAVIYGHYYYISKVDRVSIDSKNTVAGRAASEILYGLSATFEL